MIEPELMSSADPDLAVPVGTSGGYRTPEGPPRSSVSARDLDSLIAGLMSENEIEPADAIVRRLMKVAFLKAGKHEALGLLVKAGTGRDYSDPRRASGNWVIGPKIPPADVLWVAIKFAFPELADAMLDEAAEALDEAGADIGGPRKSRLKRLEDQVEALQEMNDKLATMVLDLGADAGKDYVAQFARAEDAKVRRVGERLRELRDGTGG